MRVRSACRSHRQRKSASVCLASMVIVSALVLSGCGHSNGNSNANAPKSCGTGHTSARVPVTISVRRGGVSCSTAMTIERDYAKAVDEGKAPGNGGGGPVPVDGWICTGYPTPEVLKTGNTSKCVKGSVEILATLQAG